MLEMPTLLRKRTYKKQHGFTLIEIVISLAILAMALPPLMRAFSLATSWQSSSQNETTAANLLKYKMSEIEIAGYPEETVEDEDEFGEESRFRWASKIQETDTEGLRMVIITISWEERGAERSMSASTYMADKTMPETDATTGQQQGR